MNEYLPKYELPIWINEYLPKYDFNLWFNEKLPEYGFHVLVNEKLPESELLSYAYELLPRNVFILEICSHSYCYPGRFCVGGAFAGDYSKHELPS